MATSQRDERRLLSDEEYALVEQTRYPALGKLEENAIKDLTHGRYADLTLDTSSNPDARLNAIRSTKVWGTMCFVGEGGDVHIDVSPHLLRRQLTLLASWTFSNIIQADCARFSVERGIDVDKLFTHHWSIDQADEAYKLFDKQVDGKGVFLM